MTAAELIIVVAIWDFEMCSGQLAGFPGRTAKIIQP